MANPRTATPHMEQYYSRRASEYERIYEKPERQHELEWLRRRLPALFRDKTVLEVACGTGYWTQYIARTAKKVYACDINEAVLEIAREKRIAPGRAEFFKADAISLEGAPSGCDAAFAGFWWSHVKKSELARFVESLARRLERGALVAILDNKYVEGSSTTILRRDSAGNTYQKRRLANGDEYEVLKNFPTAPELTEVVRGVAHDARLEELAYYWLLVFTLR
jgi:demethylmenaquinone methyltransferase/2-methoxy-6-polyprenyl-1,4-benzoquinol methylase